MVKRRTQTFKEKECCIGGNGVSGVRLLVFIYRVFAFLYPRKSRKRRRANVYVKRYICKSGTDFSECDY